ncbi:uncharacterized protein LOC141915043 [Tubulanus polymorphus]|uniref:uncharacterized protein LOC141915043 n=1 Tax=Tubulanus polymorphus TaxID=672921 RepID=UPI003DA2E3A7
MESRQIHGTIITHMASGVTFKERVPGVPLGPRGPIEGRRYMMERGAFSMTHFDSLGRLKPVPYPGIPTGAGPTYATLGYEFNRPQMYAARNRGSGIMCEMCNTRLVDLKRQALKHLVPNPKNKAILLGESPDLAAQIADKLVIPENFRKSMNNDRCDVCDTTVTQLKQEAVAMVQSLERAQGDSSTTTNIPALVGSRNLPKSTAPHRLTTRQGKGGGGGYTTTGSTTSPIAGQTQAYLDQNVLAWINPKKYNQMLAGPPENQMNRTADVTSQHSPVRGPPHHGQHHNPVVQLQHQLNHHHHHPHRSHSPGPNRPLSPPQMMYSPQYQQPGLPLQYHHQGQQQQQQQQQFHHGNQGYHPGYYAGGVQQFGYHQQFGSPIHGSPIHGSPVHSPHSPHSPSAAASFFARAAQKLNISSKKKKRHQPEPEPPPFPTQFSDVIRLTPPPAPPGLVRGAGRVQAAAVGKVKVLLRICQDPNVPSEGHSFMNIDPRKKQVTLHDPSTFDAYTAPSQRRGGVSAPKMFAFDAVFSPDDSLTELCASGVTDIIQAVVNGSDGCLFCYGHAKLGKTYTMIGHDDGPQSLGIIPCAIVWLFRLINEQKEKTGARFSVRVSAVEVAGKQETLKDLLADVATGQEAGIGTSPGVYLREDPISGTQLENQSELRAPTADKAAFYLDAAIAARTVTDTDEDVKYSHLLFTLHVYQYRVEKSGKGADQGISGGRSRLHLIDLGSCGKTRETGTMALTLSALGNVILSLLNGQRHIPHRDSKVSQLLRDSLGNLSCRTCMIAQVSPLIPHYNETLQVIQLAARIHRMRRRRAKWSGSASSDDSSSCASDESHRMRRPMRPRMGILREGVAYSSAISSHSDPEYTSSSEQSCDTVIYIGRNGQSLSDRELTDNEGPPVSIPIMPRTQLRYSPKPSSRASSRGSNRSSEDEGSMSDRSEGRTPKMGTTSIRRKASVPQVVTGTPSRALSPPPNSSNVVHLPRKQKAKDASSSLKFGPRSRSRDLSKELWIDGPAAATTSDSAPPAGEQWVDGPQEFIAADEKDVGSGECWIDGPPEMLSKTRHHHASHKMHKHMIAAEVYTDESQEISLVDKYHQNIARAHAMKEKQAKEQVLVEAREKLLAEQKERERIEREEQIGRMEVEVEATTSVVEEPQMAALNAENNNQTQAVYEELSNCGTLKRQKTEGQSVHEGREGRAERPTSLVSVDSVKAHKADSRPVSTLGLETCDTHQATDKQTATDDNPDNYMQVKPFVRDWVEKHSVMSSVKSAKCAEADQHMDSKITYETVVHHKQRSSRESSPMHRDEKATSPHQSPAITSKFKHEIKKRLKKQALPPPVNTNSRVAEWVQSVASTSQDVVLVDDSCYHHSLPHRSKHENTADYHTCRRTESPQRTKVRTSSRTEKRYHYSESNKVPSNQPEVVGDDNQMTIDKQSEIGDSVKSNHQSVYEQTADEELETGEAVNNSIDALKDDETVESVYSSRRSQELDYTSEFINSHLKLTEEIHIDVEPTGANNEQLSPLLSDDSQQNSDRKIVRPSCLRRPDGASNPNLNKLYEEGADESETHPLLMSPSKSSHITASTAQTVTVARTVVEDVAESKVNKVKSRPPLPTASKPSKSISAKTESVKSKKPSPSSKSGLPIFGIGKGRSISSSPGPSASKDKVTSKLPQRSASASPVSSHSSGSNAKAASKTSKGQQSVKSKVPVLPASVTKLEKSKDVRLKESKKDVKDKKDSKDKSKDPKLKETKAKDSSKSSKKDAKEVKAKDSKSSPLRASLRGSPLFRRNKDKDKDKEKEKEKKEQKEKAKDKGKDKDKKNKDSKLPVSKLSNNRVSELTGHTMLKLESDRDSGNDSAAPEGASKLLSPYSALTMPRNSMHSSSGHGSDNSSIFSGQVFSKHLSKMDQRQGGMSSGYESMLRDSEATGSSHDSTSEGSTSEKVQGTKLLRKKSSTRRSRSAPARTPDSPSISCINSPLSCRKAYSPSPRAWVDTRQVAYFSDEPLELKHYNTDDVERMHRRRLEEIQQQQIRELRYQKIRALMRKQDELKEELCRAKDRLMIDRTNWSYDLHVADQLDWDDPNYLEALENETAILEKRVDACKSHIMMVTCFDVGMSF